ncbi:L,D-transpeptidase family protein [Bianquea renquensis]|jgi:erfK/ybiS/ycfS/ynhG family protein|nr:L,D-transpeptidase family protein [Bianquea renquensis]
MVSRAKKLLSWLILLTFCIIAYQVFPWTQSLPATTKPSSDSPSILPADGTNDVLLYPILQIVTTSPAKGATLTLQDGDGVKIDGETQLDEDSVRFYPYDLLSPGTSYRLEGTIRNADGHTYTVSSNFSTLSSPMPSLWVEVLLSDVQEVRIWTNGNLSRVMPCSGGTEESPTIMGTFTLQERGDDFYSPRFQEGARYWIRIHKQYLFHSVPRDEDGNIIKAEEDKIGAPASHGCIRLLDKDAEWLYRMVPDGTMVIIHPAESIFDQSLLP